MARKNIPLTIVRPGIEEAQKITFAANAAAQTNMIPYRYPFNDIENYTALKNAGFFRHSTLDVSTELGGSKTADEATTLGFQLPRTEKLILLVKITDALTTDKTLTVTIGGSDEYNIDDIEYTFDDSVVAGDIYEIDLYNMGLYLDSNGEVQITADGTADADADDAKVSFALVARTG